LRKAVRSEVRNPPTECYRDPFSFLDGHHLGGHQTSSPTVAVFLWTTGGKRGNKTDATRGNARSGLNRGCAAEAMPSREGGKNQHAIVQLEGSDFQTPSPRTLNRRKKKGKTGGGTGGKKTTFWCTHVYYGLGFEDFDELAAPTLSEQFAGTSVQ